MMAMSLLLPTGCSDDIDTLKSDNKVDDGKVRLQIGLTLPEAPTADTRAFNRADFEFTDLYVAVFVKQGNAYFLEECVRAENPTPEWHEESNHWDFGVVLSKTDTPRRLHFIANYPGLTMGLGEEGGLIGRLVADESIDGGQHDVYWNYLDVNRIQEGTQEQLRDIPLVRNFSQVKLSVEPKDGVTLNSKFQLLGYAMHNVPTRGTVAPYNSANGTFANYVVKGADGSLSCQSYDNLEQTQGYVGNEPYDNELIKLTEFQDISTPFYMYERTHVNVDDPTCMIIKGKYDPEGKFGDDIEETYYKLDFIHRDDNTNTNVYYNMLRNFIYTMNIVDVTGEGYLSADEAIRNPASNNISGNANIDDFTNISDGTGRLFVSTTYLVFTDAEPIDIYYKYIPDINTPTVINNDLKGVNDGEIIVTAKADATKVLKSDAAVASADETTGHVGWRKVTLTPNDPPINGEDYVRTQDITIASATLQRKVTLVMRNPYEMSVNVVNPQVPSVVKSPVDLKVTIPGGMPMSLFPLKFYVSSAKNSIYAKPGGDMYSESYAGGYGFVKEITWEFYRDANATGQNAIGEPVGVKESDGRISFICNLVTNCAESATDVYVDNEYFERGQDDFVNYTIYTLTATKTVNVNIQKNNTYYPFEIHSNGANTGTENVTVKIGDEVVGEVVVNNSRVTTSPIVLYRSAAFNNGDVLTFTFSDKYYKGRDEWSNEPVTYTASCTVSQLTNGTTLNFTATTPADIVTSIDANVGVEIQKVNSRNPRTIYANGYNNGTKTGVSIKMGDVEVGTVAIDRNSVTTEPIVLANDNGINDSDVLTFTFSDNYYIGNGNWSSETITYTAQCTVAELKSGTTLEFNAPAGIKTTVLEINDVSIGVKIQRSNWRYPQSIYAGGANNGTESVTVKMGSKEVGTATIDRNNVTGDIELVNADGFNNGDNLTFTFEDKYYTSSKTWSTNKVTYTAQCTVADLTSGTTLNFTAPDADVSNNFVITTDSFNGVTVEQNNGAYPLKIFNGTKTTDKKGTYYTNPKNNGSESVTVYHKGVNVGTITIDKDSVIAGSIEINDANVDDKIEFKFTDNYCNSTQSNNPRRYYFDNTDEYATQSFKVDDFINGKVTLNFTR